ncbi:DUF3381 domain-containing protein [archaeon]|nr:MAG: DUF3381 domain-containing protein [archaeon]
MLLHPICSVHDFMLSHEPVRLLSDVHEIVYKPETDGEYETYLTEEVRAIMKDLQVIGKSIVCMVGISLPVA